MSTPYRTATSPCPDLEPRPVFPLDAARWELRTTTAYPRDVAEPPDPLPGWWLVAVLPGDCNAAVLFWAKRKTDGPTDEHQSL